MYERHENEQYFFDQATVEILSAFIRSYRSPSCLCAPSLGKHLAGLGVKVTVLDIDERFADVNGFQHFDIYAPKWVGEKFDLIVCDPPFFNVSLSQLFAAIRMLAQHDFAQPMLISYLSRRSRAIEGTFSPFSLKATGYIPGYQTVRKIAKNEIQFFGNLNAAENKRLVGAGDSDRNES